jgi:acetyltransferase-like isoleucine patch superfamily enzyme
MTAPAIDPNLNRLLDELRRLRAALAAEVRGRWARDVPFQEHLADRWERARTLGFGDGTSVHESSHIYGDVRVGAGTWIGPFTILDGSGGLEIGDSCSVSAGVQIYSHDTVRWALSGGTAEYEHCPVLIGSRCHLGANAVVLKGVTIGDGCVVGAMSLVNRNLDSGTVAVGVPARAVGSVEIDSSGAISLRYHEH